MVLHSLTCTQAFYLRFCLTALEKNREGKPGEGLQFATWWGTWEQDYWGTAQPSLGELQRFGDLLQGMSQNCCVTSLNSGWINTEYVQSCSRPAPLFMLQFVLTVIHGSGRVVKNRKAWEYSSCEWYRVDVGEAGSNHKDGWAELSTASKVSTSGEVGSNLAD